MARKIKSVYKKTKKRLLKFWGAILAFFLGLTGSNCPLYGIVALYGMPYAEFTISGKVKSSDAGQQDIPGIKVSALDESEFILNMIDEFTDENGNYSVTFSTMGAVDMDVTMRYEDVDDTANGSYTDQDIIVTIKKEDFIDDTPDNDWDDGEGSATRDAFLDPLE